MDGLRKVYGWWKVDEKITQVKNLGFMDALWGINWTKSGQKDAEYSAFQSEKT